MPETVLQRTSINGDDWCRGPRDAPVTILEYGDFECGYCGAAFPILRDLMTAQPHTLRLVYRHFPVSTTHPHAASAAEASEAAGAQGQFWAMHDLLFTHQKQLDPQHLRSYASATHCDVERFRRDLDSGTLVGLVRSDVQRGIRDGVNGTPTLFINGIRYDGPRDYASLEAAIESACSGAIHKA